jgi:glycosyltransferase involved in cell wall biosynthesis
MRILLGLHHFLDPNQGAAGVTFALGNTFQSMGHDVEYFGFEHAYPTIAQESVKLSVCFPWKLSSFLATNASRFDILDISTGDNWVWAGRGRPGSKKRQALITRSHGLEHTGAANVRLEAKNGATPLSWKYPIYHGGFRLWEVAESLRRADLSLVLNNFDRNYAIDQLKVKADRIRTVDNGIPEAFIGLPFRQDNNHDTIKIAQVGSYIPRKGIAYASKAMNRLLARHKKVSITFFGTGYADEHVYKDFDDSVRSQVSVVPRYSRQNLPELLSGYQIKLFPTLAEGFGLGLLEAMACGLAPVATDIPGPTQFAHHEKNALIVPPRDSDAIEHAVERLISNRPLLEVLRQQAYATAQNYAWHRIGAEAISLYEEALNLRS